MDKADDAISGNIEVVPVVVVSQTFPARPSSIPDIRDFVRQCLAQSPLSEQDNREVGETVSRALLEAAGPTGAINVSFRIFPDHVEVDVLKSGAQIGAPAGLDALTSLLRAHEAAAGIRQAHAAEELAAGNPGAVDTLRQQDTVQQDTMQQDAMQQDTVRQQVAADADAETFAEWMTGVLRREGLTMEAAARQLGVSVKTVSRWAGGATEPRLRDLRRIRELFGEIPFT
jgi:DNA-binding transcriptional regulator YiaG